VRQEEERMPQETQEEVVQDEEEELQAPLQEVLHPRLEADDATPRPPPCS